MKNAIHLSLILAFATGLIEFGLSQSNDPCGDINTITFVGDNTISILRNVSLETSNATGVDLAGSGDLAGVFYSDPQAFESCAVSILGNIEPGLMTFIPDDGSGNPAVGVISDIRDGDQLLTVYPLSVCNSDMALKYYTVIDGFWANACDGNPITAFTYGGINERGWQWGLAVCGGKVVSLFWGIPTTIYLKDTAILNTFVPDTSLPEKVNRVIFGEPGNFCGPTADQIESLCDCSKTPSPLPQPDTSGHGDDCDGCCQLNELLFRNVNELFSKIESLEKSATAQTIGATESNTKDFQTLLDIINRLVKRIDNLEQKVNASIASGQM